MTQGNNSPAGPASSPASSDYAASLKGSPDTRLTAFSPDDVRLKARLDSDTGVPRKDAFGSLRSIGSNGSDPFLTTPSPTGRMGLSPTASCFTPSGLSGLLGGLDFKDGLGLIDRPVFANSVKPMSNVGYLAATSEPDTYGPGDPFGKGRTASPPGFGPIGKIKMEKAPVPMLYVHFGHFDPENRKRAFAIQGVPTSLAYPNVAGLFSPREYATLQGPVLSELSSKGIVYVGFTDSREARRAAEKVESLHPDWHIHWLTAKEYRQKFDVRKAASVSDFEGQIFATVCYNASNPSLNGRFVSHTFKDLLENFGDIKVFHTLPTAQENIIEFVVEFFDTRAAENVVSTLNGTSVDDCIVDVQLHRPDVVEAHSFYPVPDYKESFPVPSMPVREPGKRRSNSHLAGSPYLELSPTGRSTVPIGDRPPWLIKREDGFDFHPRHDRFHDSRSNNQNYVDIERIRLGVDVRTTIMLRNIPNKIDQTMLKEIVDETSHGKYDFMYLRIDFANNCNVGYAFINFEDPIDIIDFATARAGHSWNCFNSDKVAEISYATIQGKDCLVQKFRNSSVMLEHPSFRPKIFHTGSGPLAGTEDRFPGPDNPSKMRRSVENAEHVGLFAPRVGQQYRDEQRRRRSQFDRGTTAAEREAYWMRSGTSGTGNGNGRRGTLTGGMVVSTPGHQMLSPWYDSMDCPRTS